MGKYKDMLIKINDYLDTGEKIAVGSQAHFEIRHTLGIKKQDEPTQVFNMFFDEFTFGKFGKKHMTLMEALDTDKPYIKWCVDNNVIGVSKGIEDRFNRKLEE